jgi:hypothetical protein
LHLEANLLPLSAASDTFVKVLQALKDLITQHVVFVDLGPTSLDDLIADLCQ